MSEPQPWLVQLSPGAMRALDRLPHKVSAAMAEFITATLPTDPYLMSKPLRFELEGWRVARRGGYRVTFRLLLSLIHISEPTRLIIRSRMPSSA